MIPMFVMLTRVPNPSVCELPNDMVVIEKRNRGNLKNQHVLRIRYNRRHGKNRIFKDGL
jgi:hypothetical protein